MSLDQRELQVQLVHKEYRATLVLLDPKVLLAQQEQRETQETRDQQDLKEFRA